MRQDVLLRAKVTFPFSSEISTLVDEPEAQVDRPGPEVLAKDITEANEPGKGDSSTPVGESSEIAGTSSVGQSSPTEAQTNDSSLTPDGPRTPISSESKTVREDSDWEDEPSQESRKLQIWFGGPTRLGFDDSYLSM